MKTIAYLFLICALTIAASAAQGGTKEELARLQSDVLALQNQIRMFEKSFSEQTQNLKSLVSQLNENVGKSNTILNKIATTLESQEANVRTSNQNMMREIQKLTTRVDENGTRISALAQQLSDLKVDSKALSARRFQTLGGDGGALSPDTVFSEAYNDFIQGNLDLAIQGFTAFVANYPASEKVDDAQYYIGEAYYNEKKMPQAIAAFTRVLNEWPSGDKVASAMFKRGLAELSQNERDNAIEDFKAVIAKFPTSPEANLARGQLEALGIDLSKQAKPSSARRKP